MTQFEKILEFNKAFDLKTPDTPYLDIKKMNYRLDLIKEEYQELMTAIKNKDLVETLDAIIDSIYVLHGLTAFLGYNGDLLAYTHEIIVKESYTGENVWDTEMFQRIIKTISKQYCTLIESAKYINLRSILKAITCEIQLLHEFVFFLGFDSHTLFNIVHHSNMSKLCISEIEAKQTVSKYLQEKIYDSPNYKKSSDDIHWIVYNESTGKILKSINYTPVQFFNKS